MSVKVVTDSVASIPPELARELGIEVVPLFVTDGEHEEADTEIDVEQFWERLARMDGLPTSSQPSVASFVAAFTRAVEQGISVLGVFISEKMSGTCQAARLAAGIVRERIPEAMIEILDSRSNSLQEGFAAIAAARAALAGQQLEGCVAAALDTMRRTRYLFTPHTLEYLRRGGRIGAAAALLGSLLEIRPVLTVIDGQAGVFARVRTQTRALAEIARQFQDDVSRYGLKQVVVHYIADRETAASFARERIEPIAERPVPVLPVSPVIGLHVGPAVGLCYETEREIA